MSRDDVNWIRKVFLDASALVSYVLFGDENASEPGGDKINSYINQPELSPYTNNPCLAEALTVLKRKWQKDKTLTFEGYDTRVYILKSYVEGGHIEVSDFNFWERGYSDKALELSRKYKIDFLDAVQIVDIQEGPFKSWAGPSTPLLITADKELCKAARAEGLLVWYPVTEDSPG